MDSAQLLGKIALARNLIKAGSEPDYQRASKMVLDDFRNGKTGRITLEDVPGKGESLE
jgi:ribosome biogenesis GTPase A